MARTVRDSRLENHTARDKLPIGKIAWRTITPKLLHLGYKRKRKNEAGQWIVRHYLGLDSKGVGRYNSATIGAADDFADSDGQSILSYAEAQKIALSMNPTARRAGTLTVGEAMADYVAWLRAHRSIGDLVARRVAMYIVPALGHVRVSDLTTDMINRWRDDLAASPSPTRTARGMPQNYRPFATKDAKRARKVTTNMILQILRTGLNRAYNAGLVDDDKAWRRAKYFDKVSVARTRFLSVEECQRLINAASAETGFRSMVHGALLTGCRYGELCRLHVGDFQHGKVLIRESKSGKPRWVRLTEEGVAFFESLTVGRAKDAIMLPRYRSGKLMAWGMNHQLAVMGKICKAASISPPITFHGLRHTWASLSVMAGMPLMVVADNLGHADTKMVEKHYGHLTTSYKDQAIADHAPRYGLVQASNVQRIA